MKVVRLLLFSTGFYLVHSQSFISAISAYTELSEFTNLMINNSTLAESLLNTSVVHRVQTILAPSNDAFAKYQQTTGRPFESLDPNYIQRILQYHTLNTSLTSAILAKQPDIVVSTQLTDTEYNEMGSADNTNLNTNGQVVYITPSGNQTTFRIGQSPSTASVDSGLGSIGTIDVIDGAWSGGGFQIVDT
jgi:uncharacterized surface protein with fasciclin (FAS1) repeats